MSVHFGGRTLARSQALQLLFQAEANCRSVLEVLDGDYALSEGPLDDYARRLALGADERRPDLDAVISTRATGWSLRRLNAVDRNILRLALFEMLFVDEVDVPVSIDECVELAKAYGTSDSSRFVNGVLGRVADDLDAGIDVVASAREHATADADAACKNDDDAASTSSEGTCGPQGDEQADASREASEAHSAERRADDPLASAEPESE